MSTFVQLHDRLKNLTMDKNYTAAYEVIFKRFIQSLLLLIAISLIVGGIGYYETYPVNYFLALMIFLVVFSLVIVCIVPTSYIRRLVKFYLIFMVINLLPMTVFYLSKGIATVIFWYFPIPVFIYTVFSHEKAIKRSFYCAGVLLLAFILSYILRTILYKDEFVHLYYNWLFYGDVVNAISALLMVYLCLHYLHKFHQLQIKQLTTSMEGSRPIKNNYIVNIDDDKFKYRQIYSQIEEYFKTREPYLDPDFKIVQMAHELNINSAYLAKAIRLEKDMNFNTFVNAYRIEKVKELIYNDSRKYTLKHIYLSSGFKNQSSFNKAFKLKEGITPSEYYKQNKLEAKP